LRILITNDDGVHAEGLLALREALAPLGPVTIVAPDRPRSACGHSITLHKPLRVVETRLPDGSAAYSTTGTPSDCVSLATLDIMRDAPPELVISGINHGPNLGWDLTYSGTVSAAMEAAITGYQSFAISYAWRLQRVQTEEGEPTPQLDFTAAAAFAAFLTRRLATQPLPPFTMLNVNVPPGSPRGVEVTRQGVRRYPGKVERRIDPTGRAYYWLGGDEPEDRLDPGSDVAAIADHRISVTPIQLDLTDYPVLEALSGWSFEGWLPEDRMTGFESEAGVG
jgi:5'-nucleotidase